MASFLFLWNHPVGLMGGEVSFFVVVVNGVCVCWLASFVTSCWRRFSTFLSGTISVGHLLRVFVSTVAHLFS